MTALCGVWGHLGSAGGQEGSSAPPRDVFLTQVFPQGPAEPGRVLGWPFSPSRAPSLLVSAPLTPDSHQRGPCRLPPSVPGGLRLGVAQSCWSPLICFHGIGCAAGQVRGRSPLPSLGVPACRPSRILPQPTPTHFSGHLTSPALLGEVGGLTTCIEGLFRFALFFQLLASTALPP